MKTIDRIEHIQIELREIGRDMGGINPKTSLYQSLQRKADKLNEELNRLRAESKNAPSHGAPALPAL